MTHDMTHDMDELIPPMTEALRARFAAATETMHQLADQVGIRCGECGAVIHGRDQIGGVSFLAPLFTEDYQGRPYCVPCADRLHEQDV